MSDVAFLTVEPDINIVKISKTLDKNAYYVSLSE